MLMGPDIIHDQNETCKGGQEYHLKRTLGGAPQASDRDKKRQYVDFHLEEFWKDKEEAAATGAPMPDDFQLMAIIFGGLSRSHLYGAGSEAAHLRADSNRAAAGLPPCCLEAEQRIMRGVEGVVSSVCASFDKHMRQFAE
ncbi:hypothetical protein M9H77_09221 [Catharanthus roseus]|uniref:Uncharacterized protein n=1 Tax=Catharanthus roseus TaxID=4058 RepID=A0ACC0C019_CATRO|nr:hypothetical protein M9H77_09221 [Catharanthus roseus]